MANTPYAGPLSNRLEMRDVPRVRQILGVLTFIMHRANIARLMSGTESKIGQKA